MIGWLIDISIRNRLMVLLVLGALAAGGLWAVNRTSIDAIPDLSDVQVVIRTEFPGQAPEIIEDQVTYPLTTAMLAVPKADVVRGYSMFGSSFVYIIFDDGTDPYWARSRVLEQLSTVAGKLPAGVTPQLGPDASGVGWVYQYVLRSAPYCAEFPNGIWLDPETETYFASPAMAPDDADVQARLVRRRVFPAPRKAFYDATARKTYTLKSDAPTDVQARLTEVTVAEGFETCPVGGGALVEADIDLAELRTLQDWLLRYELTSVDGVSEVASVGGFVKQYQVVVDPVKLRAYDMSLATVKTAVQRSNLDVGGRVIEISETEYMVRGIGYLGSLTDEVADAARATNTLGRVRTAQALEDLRTTALGANPEGIPIILGDVADVRVGPEIRRGVTDWDGLGEAVGGIVVMRYEENARATIARVKAKIFDIEKSLPPGIAIETAYDRSDLIGRAVETLSHTLLEEILVVTLICFLFLLHARSALVAAFVLPAGVLLSLLLMHLFGINANIMSLGGIAIAIGVMVDSSIIMVENAHKHLELEGERVLEGHSPRSRASVIAEAAREVGPSLFASLLIIVVSFLPVFALGDESGRLMKPLAYTKTFSMAIAAVLAVTVIPVLMVFFIRDRVVPESFSRRLQVWFIALVVGVPALILALIPLGSLADYRLGLVIAWIVLSLAVLLPQRLMPEHKNPISRVLERIYDPAFAFIMRHRAGVLIGAVLAMVATLYPLSQLGSEFMPPLEEGDLLYMPTTDPGISVDKARELLQQTNTLIHSFPEVVHVFGKAGRAETATDPAPPSMLETTITLERDKTKWRQIPSGGLFGGTRPITTDELIYGYDLPGPIHVPGLDEVVRFPGLTNSWTMPIKTRIDMLSTGIKTPVGIKVMGPDLTVLAGITKQITEVIKTDASLIEYVTSAFPEKSVGGKYLDIRLDRPALERFGLNVADVQDVIMSAMGGMNVTFTVEGLERYPVNVRYPHELRDNIPSLEQTLVATPSGAQVPLTALASLSFRAGPPMIKSENARRTSWVYVDIAGIDVGTFVNNAKVAVENSVQLPTGYTIVWSGQFEYMQAANERLLLVIPVAALVIIFLLYFATRSWLRVGIVLLAVPFSLVGAFWLLYFMDYELSLAVWVGVIALAGLDAETGLVMLLYLDTSFERFEREGRMHTPADLRLALHDGAVKRIRPKTMTVFTTFIGLFPLLWADGAGADTMRRLAVPMIGGLATSFLMELLVYPVIFDVAKTWSLRRRFRGEEAESQPDGDRAPPLEPAS